MGSRDALVGARAGGGGVGGASVASGSASRGRRARSGPGAGRWCARTHARACQVVRHVTLALFPAHAAHVPAGSWLDHAAQQ
jgi:hypothetical protein